mmetsp:Transcript_161551/g.513426  ORF Transcript_161551/g.513426 Transcript_161551/m.513426 type:complete len:408 (+) Transcript_161551:116-1339(+)
MAFARRLGFLAGAAWLGAAIVSGDSQHAMDWTASDQLATRLGSSVGVQRGGQVMDWTAAAGHAEAAAHDEAVLRVGSSTGDEHDMHHVHHLHHFPSGDHAHVHEHVHLPMPTHRFPSFQPATTAVPGGMVFEMSDSARANEVVEPPHGGISDEESTSTTEAPKPPPTTTTMPPPSSTTPPPTTTPAPTTTTTEAPTLPPTTTLPATTTTLAAFNPSWHFAMTICERQDMFLSSPVEVNHDACRQICEDSEDCVAVVLSGSECHFRGETCTGHPLPANAHDLWMKKSIGANAVQLRVWMDGFDLCAASPLTLLSPAQAMRESCQQLCEESAACVAVVLAHGACHYRGLTCRGGPVPADGMELWVKTQPLDEHSPLAQLHPIVGGWHHESDLHPVLDGCPMGARPPSPC